MCTTSYRLGPLILAAALVVAGSIPSALAQQSRPQTFTSATQATEALYEAVKSNNQAATTSMLGPVLAASDSDTEGKANRERFVQKYNEMHRLVRELDGTTVLYIGAENWPFPVPLVEQNDKWQFDADGGVKEVRAREIGRDETTAIQICHWFVIDANGSGANRGAIQEFAAVLRNSSNANSNSDSNGSEFGGYYFKVVNDKETGVRLVAYPADYWRSGIATFIVTADGSVYQTDFGNQTAELAPLVREKSGSDWALVR